MDEQLGRSSWRATAAARRVNPTSWQRISSPVTPSTDAWEKRGRKGYLFIIGDEMNKPVLTAEHLRQVLGDRPQRQCRRGRSSTGRCSERWHTLLHPAEPVAVISTDQQVRRHWQRDAGRAAAAAGRSGGGMRIDRAVTIGLVEGAIDLAGGLDDLQSIGSAHGKAVGKALAASVPGADRHRRRAADKAGRREWVAMTPPNLDPGARHVSSSSASGSATRARAPPWTGCARRALRVGGVRFNGGAQAAHNVVADGVHHTFAQFGSGTLAGSADLSRRDMLVEPMAWLAGGRRPRPKWVFRIRCRC